MDGRVLEVKERVEKAKNHLVLSSIVLDNIGGMGAEIDEIKNAIDSLNRTEDAIDGILFNA